MSDKLKVKGTARGICRYDDGRVVVVEQGNMIVNSGFDMLIKSLIKTDGRPNPLSHVAIGNGTTATNASMTALESEHHRGEGTWTWSEGAKSFTISTTFPKGDITENISEGGVFNASLGGDMFDRVVFLQSTQGTSDMTYTQEFTFEVM